LEEEDQVAEAAEDWGAVGLGLGVVADLGWEVAEVEEAAGWGWEGVVDSGLEEAAEGGEEGLVVD